jgi:aldose 1-epimerase
MTVPPSGEQWEIHYGGARATVVEVGGGLREYQLDGVDVLDPFPRDAMCDGAHNMPLVPWPNHIRDGRYRFDGRDYQVPLTEPTQHNAIHGFGRWRNWTLRERDADRLVVGLTLRPQKGYPFALDVAIEYRLGEGGLTTRVSAWNVGDNACPYGFGQHTYLACDGGMVDTLEVELKAAAWLPTGAQQIPSGAEPVDGSGRDFRVARPLGALKIDNAFTALARDDDGRAWAWVRSPSGRRLGLWVDAHFRYLQLYSGDTLAPERRRRALAVEPMTCAPNAFATGEGLICLESGASVTGAWGIVVG